MGGYSFTPTGHLVSDQFPFDTSKKAIHTIGSAGLARFNWNSNASKYTGLFKKAEEVFIRFSTGTPPGTFEGHPVNGPGISIKGLRDGVNSGNILLMLSLLGSPTENFFGNCYSNHIDSPPGEKMSMPQKILLHKFESYDPKPSLIGVSDWATHTQDGKKEDVVKAPMALYFQPNPKVTELCAGKPMGVHNNPSLYGCIEDLPKDTEMFKVYAIERPYTVAELETIKGQGVLQLIGTLVLTSEGMKPSKFADDRLKFKHVYWSDDIKAISGASKWDVQASADYQSTAGCSKYITYAPAY